MRIDFDDGGWAEIHSAAEMPRRVSARLEDLFAEIPQDQPGYQALRSMARMRDTLISMVVKQWSYGDAPTGEPEDLYDLPDASYKRLVAETADHWKAAGFTEARSEAKETSSPKSSKTNSSA